MRAPGEIVTVVLYRDAHLWNWEIYDTAGVWTGWLEISVSASLEEATRMLAGHVARNWGGQDLPGSWKPQGDNSWRAGPPPSAAEEMDDWPRSPTHDWPSVLRCGDVVRLDDGRLAVVGCLLDYGPEPPAKWKMVVRTLGRNGHLDDTIWMPWKCRPAPEAREEAERQGLL